MATKCFFTQRSANYTPNLNGALCTSTKGFRDVRILNTH